MNSNYLISIKKQFSYYKMLGEKTFEQMPDEKLFWKYNENSNSIAIIVKHLWGNMLSRWTDFLDSDGEKQWRDRDAEFESDVVDRQEIIEKWNEAWGVLFNSLDALSENDLNKIVYIRNQGHTVIEAINRQLAHYSYHVGQIVFIGKLTVENWTSLSIPKNTSKTFNMDMFSKTKKRKHFTDDYLNNSINDN